MPRRLALLPFAFLAAACTAQGPRVHLVPAAALTTLLPDSVGTYGATSDETFRGYFAEDGGVLALVTVMRSYLSGAAVATLSVSSVGDPARYLAVVRAGGGAPLPDSLVAADPTLRTAHEGGWTVYAVPYGLVLADGAGHAVEAKSTFPGFAQDALGAVDLGRLAALPEEEVVVDETFLREMPTAPGAATTDG